MNNYDEKKTKKEKPEKDNNLSQEIMEMSIDNLHFSKSLYTKMSDSGIKTIGQLIDIYKKNKRLDLDFYASSINKYIIEREILLLLEKGSDYFCQEPVQKNLPSDILEISVDYLHISDRTKERLLFNDILKIDDVLQLTKDKSLPYFGKKGQKELQEQLLLLLEKGDKYFNFSEIQEQKNRNLDVETILNLNYNYGLKLALAAEWYGISRETLSKKLHKRVSGQWCGKKLYPEEYGVIEKMISDNSFHFNSEGIECYLLNNLKDDAVFIFIYDDDIKCFYLKDLPQEIQKQILDKNLHKLSENEVKVLPTLGRFVSVFGEKCFQPEDAALFNKLAHGRQMNVDEYSYFLFGVPHCRSGSKTDEEVISFLEEHTINGKTTIPINSDTKWLINFIDRCNCSVNDFVSFYGFSFSFSTE